MNGREEFAFFIDEMLNCAVKEFKETEQYKLLQEKLDQMDRNCDTMFMSDQKEFAVECLELILDVDGRVSQAPWKFDIAG
jgi:predicted P-loop ATPase